MKLTKEQIGRLRVIVDNEMQQHYKKLAHDAEIVAKNKSFESSVIYQHLMYAATDCKLWITLSNLKEDIKYGQDGYIELVSHPTPAPSADLSANEGDGE